MGAGEDEDENADDKDPKGGLCFNGEEAVEAEEQQGEEEAVWTEGVGGFPEEEW